MNPHAFQHYTRSNCTYTHTEPATQLHVAIDFLQSLTAVPMHTSATHAPMASGHVALNHTCALFIAVDCNGNQVKCTFEMFSTNQSNMLQQQNLVYNQATKKL